jgi:hypothetical protein
MTSPLDYQYTKIRDRGTIRLIQLEPSKDLQAPIKCSLIHATLASYENSLLNFYIALSYVWGDAELSGTVSVDGKRLAVTASLDTALRHLRDSHVMLHIWADGVCINQKRVEDRNFQVSQMGLIYSTARHTIIFLGPSSPPCEAALDAMRPTSSAHPGDDSIPGSGPSEFPCMEVLDKQVLNRPWFSRTWIFQELILSQDPWVQIGKTKVKWLHFSRFILSIPEADRSQNMGLVAGMSEARTKIRHRHESSEGGVFKASSQNNYWFITLSLTSTDHPGKALLDVLRARRGLGVTDPKDVVFAHLGMIGIQNSIINYQYQDQDQDQTTTATQTLDEKYLHDMAIDYDKGVVQVYEDTARFILHDIPWTLLLPHVENGDQETRLPGLASWVPDWTQKWALGNTVSDREPEGRTRHCVFPAPGVLAFEGTFLGTVTELLPGPWLPNAHGIKSLTRRVRGTEDAEDYQIVNDEHIVEWIRNSPDSASKVLQVLLAYSMGMEVAFKRTHEQSFIGKLRPWDLAEHQLEASPTLTTLLTPTISIWAGAFSGNEIQMLEVDGMPRGKLPLVLTTLFVDNLRRLVIWYGRHQARTDLDWVLGPIASRNIIALTSVGEYTFVPQTTRMNDVLCRISPPRMMYRDFIFRPTTLDQQESQIQISEELSTLNDGFKMNEKTLHVRHISSCSKTGLDFFSISTGLDIEKKNCIFALH